MNGTEELNDTEEPVKLRMNPEQLAQLRKLSQETGRTVAELIDEALNKAYGLEQEKP